MGGWRVREVFSPSLTLEREDAHLSWCFGPDYLSDGCKVFTIATDSWSGDRRKIIWLSLC